MTVTNAKQQKQDEIDELKRRLEESEETLRAIRQYMVDAFVVDRSSENEVRVLTLHEAEFPYRMMVESMNEGAVTLIPDGTIFYSNERFAEMVHSECEKLIGTRFQDLIPSEQQSAFEAVFAQAGQEGVRGEFFLKTASDTRIPVQLSMYKLTAGGASGISIIATDLSERMQAERKIRSLASELTRAEQQERQRISQILHDDLQQRLFAIKAQFTLIKDAGGKDRDWPSMQRDLDQMQDWLNEAISITRNLSADLSPVVLQAKGLKDAFLWLTSHMEEQHGLEINLEAREISYRLDDHVRLLLFQAARELLFNVVKHAGARQATVTLEQADQRVRITVKDQGKGFDVAAVMSNPQAAHGLLFIQSRLNLIGSTMKVTSTPGAGTTVLIETPLGS